MAYQCQDSACTFFAVGHVALWRAPAPGSGTLSAFPLQPYPSGVWLVTPSVAFQPGCHAWLAATAFFFYPCAGGNLSMVDTATHCLVEQGVASGAYFSHTSACRALPASLPLPAFYIYHLPTTATFATYTRTARTPRPALPRATARTTAHAYQRHT